MRVIVLIPVMIILFLTYTLIIIIPFNLIAAEPSGWEDDLRLTDDPANSYYQDINTDVNDNIHVVWKDERQNEGTGGIYYKSYIDSSWSNDLILNPNEPWGLKPTVTVDNNNYIHVVWYATGITPSSLDIFHRSFEESTWTDINRIAVGASYTNTGNAVSYPEIVVDSIDNIYIFWSGDRNPIDSPFTNYHQVSYISYDGSEWSDISDLTNATYDHLFDSVSIDSDDNVHVAYTDRWPDGSGGFYFSIQYQKYDGNDWSPQLKIDDSDIAASADIIADLQKNVHITWADGRSGNYELYYSKLDSDSNVLIDNKRLTYNPDPPGWHGVWRKSSAIDGKNNIHVTWHNQDEDDLEEYTTKYLKLDSNGEILLNITNLTLASTENDNTPKIAIDSKDRIHLVFMDDRDGNQEIYYKTGKFYDLSLSSTDIEFSDSLPSNGENIVINATIHNLGGYIINATIKFYQDSISVGNQIGSDSVSVQPGGTELAFINWNANTGIHDIWVEIESESGIEEINLTNNIAYKTINVNDPPSITVTAPPTGIATVDKSYMISWVAEDPDDNAQIQLFYDLDNTGYDGILISTSDQYPSGIVDDNGATQSYVWDTSGLPDGSSYYIYAKIDDGIHEPVYLYSPGKIKIDHQNIAPTIDISSPSGGTHSGIVTIHGTASDDVSVSVVEVRIDNNPWEEATGTTSWSHEWYTTSYTNGEHTITARSKDDNGLYSQEDFVTVIVNNGGNLVPSVDINSHTMDEVISGTVKIEGISQDSDGFVELVEIKIDNENWQTASGVSSWSYNWDTTSYSNGEHEIHVRAKDNSGEYSEIETITLIVNNGGNIPPKVTIISPSGGTVSGTVTIYGSASDLDGDNTISYVELKVEEDWEPVNGITEWTYEWDTTELDDGEYIIYARANDGTEYSMEKSVEVSVDNPHAPTLTLNSEIPDEASGTVKIRGTASDVDGEIVRIEIQIDDGEWVEISGTTNWDYELDTTKLSDGEHTIRIRALDDEGEYHEESYAINVNNSSFIVWLIIFVVIIIVLVLIIPIGLMRKKSQKAATEPLAPLPVAQVASQSISCPQCRNVFEVLLDSTTVQCPNCGTRGSLQ